MTEINIQAKANGMEPAFALPSTLGPHDNVIWGSCGLTKREYFALHLMSALFAYTSRGTDKALAVSAILAADALLIALTETKTNDGN